MKVVPSGIKRFKQHLAGGFGDTMKCARVPEVVSKDMQAYLKKTRSALVLDDDESIEGEDDAAAAPVQSEPSSGTKYKQAKKVSQAAMSSFVVSAPPKPATQKGSKSVAAMLCKSPEEVIAEPHSNKASQSTLEHCTKKGKEVQQIVDDHVADFLYENNIPLNVVNSRSWEIMLESIGQYGPGYRGPSYHDIRVPWLERAVERTSSMTAKHEESWKEYGCSLMSDSWTDVRGRHLINFLANSPAGTHFLCSIDASSEIANANMLADLLENQIDKIGRENVVQVVTDNGQTSKLLGGFLWRGFHICFGHRVLPIVWICCWRTLGRLSTSTLASTKQRGCVGSYTNMGGCTTL
jgi:hypothetical protein